jgi:serine/threonine protein phosphatase PrpC
MLNRTFKIFGDKNIGGRNSQQDSLYFGEFDNQTVMVVADGMGGHKGGEIASQIAINLTEQHFKRYISQNKSILVSDFFKQLMPDINESILQEGKKQNITPHTTIVIAIIKDEYIYYAHIGDSRLYIFDDEGLILRTRDHSVPEMLFQMGNITESEMATHPDQNKLTKSLGGKIFESCTIDKYRLNPKKNYAIVLCSDGLWEYFNTKQMHNILFRSDEEIEEKVDSMITQALEVGGIRGDNISLIIAKSEPIKEVITHNIQFQLSQNRNILVYALSSIIAILVISLGVLLFLNFYNDTSVSPYNGDRNISKKDKDYIKKVFEKNRKDIDNGKKKLDEAEESLKKIYKKIISDVNKTKCKADDNSTLTDYKRCIEEIKSLI